MTKSRFAYLDNVALATQYRDRRNSFWPPAKDYHVLCLDIGSRAPSLGPDFLNRLEILRGLVEAEWQECKLRGAPGRTRMHRATEIAASLRRIAECLPGDTDRRALSLRADAVERGYDEDSLSALAEIDEESAFVAGQIATWYGKQTGGLPTAFGCIRNADGRAAVAAALSHGEAVPAYLQDLHMHLRLGDVPAFAPVDVFFMAGEGNRHPKHIAYFLPEDEGVKRSPFKKTYYFANTHRALVEGISLPHARRMLDIGHPIPAAGTWGQIPTLGVLVHEMGHFVHRKDTSFAALNAEDRWASVVLQEVAADVFGILILADVMAPGLGLDPLDALAYHLSECLRYVDRGLGLFPDCDGMFLQLSYLTAFGALSLDGGPLPRFSGDLEIVKAGFRSLARVLADTLLAGNVPRTLALHRDYGPAMPDRLLSLVRALGGGPQKTIEYLQEPAPEHRTMSAVA